jgi:hypothetical protein
MQLLVLPPLCRDAAAVLVLLKPLLPLLSVL